MPAPTWTEGPSRPSGMPLASVAEVQKNLPRTVRRVILPSRAKRAALVWGTPEPRASGKIAPEQIADDERADDGKGEASPGRAADGVDAHADALGGEDEGDDGEAGEGSDDDGEEEEEAVL